MYVNLVYMVVYGYCSVQVGLWVLLCTGWSMGNVYFTRWSMDLWVVLMGLNFFCCTDLLCLVSRDVALGYRIPQGNSVGSSNTLIQQYFSRDAL